LILLLISPLLVDCPSQERTEDHFSFTNLLDEQLEGIQSYLIPCKWPVTITSWFFITLLSWEMAGDTSGWFDALWVLILAVLMLVIIWIWDRMLAVGMIDFEKIPLTIFDVDQAPLPNSLEIIVRSSLHHSPSPEEEEQNL
jgi:hypothetical protein